MKNDADTTHRNKNSASLHTDNREDGAPNNRNEHWLRNFEDPSEIHDIVCKKQDNKHIAFLVELLGKDVVSTDLIFAYGMRNLPQEKERPDSAVSSFFYIVSEIKDLSRDMRDLAMDAMVYAENDSYFPTESYRELQNRYTHLKTGYDRESGIKFTEHRTS